MMFKMFFHYKKYKIKKLKGAIVTPLKWNLHWEFSIPVNIFIIEMMAEATRTFMAD